MSLQIIYNIYKEDLAFDNFQWMIYYKTQPNQSNEANGYY